MPTHSTKLHTHKMQILEGNIYIYRCGDRNELYGDMEIRREYM